MRICPACHSENIEGVDECQSCGVSLTLDDTSPEYKISRISHIINDPIKSLTLDKALVVSPKVSLANVINLMIENQNTCALVVQNKELLGIFTERDVLNRINRPEYDLEDIEVQNMMTKAPEVLDEDDAIAFAIHKMAVGRFRHVPVKRKDGSYCVVSIKDAVNYLF